MPMDNLIQYSDIYSKTSESLWQYDRDKSALNHDGGITDFSANNSNILFKLKKKKNRLKR